MSINFEALKMGFKAYLEGLEKKSDTSEQKGEVTDLSEVSIFLHAEEFKEYVSEELSIDLSDIPMDISELMDMEIVNGELVDKEELNTDSTNNTEENSEENIMTNLVSELLKDSDFIKNVDNNGDNAVNTEEITNFFKFISINDENKENVSLDDIFIGLEQLKKGEYDASKTVNATDIDTEELQETKTPKETKVSSSGGGGGGSFNYNSSPKTEPKEKSYEDMSLDELSTLKTDYETKKEETKGLINDVHSGENAVVKSAQESLDEKKNAYDEAVKNDKKISNELKTEKDNNLNSISEKESSINNLNISINEKDNAIYDTTSQITAKNSELSALKASLSKLQSSTTDDKEIQAQIQAQKQAVQSQIAQTEESIKQLEEQKTTLEEEKKGLEENLTKEEEELTVLEEERSDIEARIFENSGEETKLALKEFQTAKTNIQTVKNQQLKLAEGFLSQFETELDKISNIYNEKNSNKIQKDNHVSTSKLFDGKSNLVAERINEDGIIPYVLIGPENVDPNEELPVLVYMHGSGGGTSSSNPYDFELASVIDNWNLEDFNGYILCPQLTGNYYMGDWNNEKAEGYIRDMLSSFEQNHAVDKNNIAVSGYSLGGMGSIYMSEHMDDIFTKSAVISGYDIGIDTKGIDIPIMGYVGKNENRDEMKKLFERNLGEEYLLTLEAHHGNIDEEVFKRDSNQNGRSDIIEWLFNDKEYEKELPD